MGVLGHFRRFRGAGGLVLLFLCGGQPLHGLLRIAMEASHEETAVAATRIEVADTDAPAPICHHHPEGCPKDCYCPKIVPEAAAPAHGHPEASVREPSLVQCTEGAPGDSAPHLMAGWIQPPTGLPDLHRASGRAPAARTGSAHDPFLDPPLAVPRA